MNHALEFFDMNESEWMVLLLLMNKQIFCKQPSILILSSLICVSSRVVNLASLASS